MSYLRNVWYVAAWASEVKPGQMLTRTLLEERVLMFRDEAGEARALFDQCPHRFAPLSMGKLCDGGRYVQCGYHGLQFDGKGACVSNPHGPVPKAAKVKSYPLVERYSVLWIWMGDPEQADPARIPVFHFMDPEHWYVGQEYLEVDANYVLESDNILDLSHIQYLHPSTLGSGQSGEGKTVVTQEDNSVWSRRFVRDEILPPFLYEAIGIPQGTMGEELAQRNTAGLRAPFLYEDKPMVEAQQRQMAGRSFWDMKPLLLDVDAPAVRARRVLEQLIAAEGKQPSASH